MAKQIKSRRAAAAAQARVEARDLWLAGLGAVSLTRKNSIKLYSTLRAEGQQFQGRAERRIDALQRQARDGFASAKARVEAAVKPLRQRAEATFGTVKSEVETRLKPVLVKLGVKRAQARARKAATRARRKPAVAKRTVRKAA